MGHLAEGGSVEPNLEDAQNLATSRQEGELLGRGKVGCGF